jgi:hypothetical protein
MIDEPTVTYLDGLGADGVYFLPLSGTPGPSIQSGTAHACLPLADQTQRHRSTGPVPGEDRCCASTSPRRLLPLGLIGPVTT